MAESDVGIFERLERGDYRNKLEYPTGRYDGAAERRKEYREEDNRIRRAFREDVLRDVGLDGHPKASMLWDKAWERGHSSGYYEVYNEVLDLSELLI